MLTVRVPNFFQFQRKKNINKKGKNGVAMECNVVPVERGREGARGNIVWMEWEGEEERNIEGRGLRYRLVVRALAEEPSLRWPWLGILWRGFHSRGP